VRFLEALESPAPGFETLRWVFRHVCEVGPVGTAWSGFVHECLRAQLTYGRNSNSIGMLRELSEEWSAMTMCRRSALFALAARGAFA
jgi:hypothetical protein